ncbi:MAG TPA: OmpA family protein [Puia sp.]|nr:OmpA family protein [Puia sp.]
MFLAIPFRLSRGTLFLLTTVIATGLYAQPAKADTFILHFGFDRSEVRPVDSGALRSFIGDRLLSSSDIDSIGITGYTDTVGTPEYNDRLSLRRATTTAVLFRQWLGSASSLPVRVEGRGEADALPGDDSGSRRVTIICWHRPPPPPVVAKVDTPRITSEPDTVFELDDIRFFANTTNLTEEARLALPRRIDYLLSLKDRFLEIDGYCNSPGPPLSASDPLYVLSVKRAKFIYDCLVERGFDPDRLVYKGKGNTNPRNAHPTTRGEMDQNMRVEIRVYKKRPATSALDFN